MKKLMLIGLAFLLVLGLSILANAQEPFPGEKVLVTSTDPVPMGKLDPTDYTYRIDLDELTAETLVMDVLDVVPAEFDITSCEASCGQVTCEEKKKPGDKLRPDHITWDLNGGETTACTIGSIPSLTVNFSTDKNPGHWKRSINFYEPTECGPLSLNDGAIMVDPITEEETEASNSLSVAACVNEETMEAYCDDADDDGWSVDCGDCIDTEVNANPGIEKETDITGGCEDLLDNDCDELVDGDDPDCQT